MMHIKYKLADSSISGVGLFAGQDIASGNRIYTPNPVLDVDIDEATFENLSKSEQEEIKYYGYFNSFTNKWHVAFDVIRFLNHGNKGSANVSQDESMVMRAVRDITAGEELLQDYIEIYPQESQHWTRIKN